MSSKLLIEKSCVYTKYAILNSNKLKYIKIISNDKYFKLDEIYLAKVIKKNKNMNSLISEVYGKEIFVSTKNNIPVGDKILVRIQREEEKTKKARATMDISISNDCFVIIQNEKGIIFSKKIIDKEKIKLLEKNLNVFSSNEYGILVRTESINKEVNELEISLKKLIKEYNDILCTQKEGLVYSPYANEYFIKKLIKKFSVDEIKVNDKELYESLRKKFINQCEIKYDDIFLFNHNNINLEEMIKISYVYDDFDLKINYLEALTVFDVNSGYMKNNREKELKILEINKAAFIETLNIINLLEIGGIILIDFISMKENEKNKFNNFIENFIKNIYNIDRKISFSKLSDSCLLEIILEKKSQNIVDFLSCECDKCFGRGLVLKNEAILDDIEIRLQSYLANSNEIDSLDIHVNKELMFKKDFIDYLEERYSIKINFIYNNENAIKILGR